VKGVECRVAALSQPRYFRSGLDDRRAVVEGAFGTLCLCLNPKRAKASSSEVRIAEPLGKRKCPSHHGVAGLARSEGTGSPSRCNCVPSTLTCGARGNSGGPGFTPAFLIAVILAVFFFFFLNPLREFQSRQFWSRV
jgi:hypothetical protein